MCLINLNVIKSMKKRLQHQINAQIIVECCSLQYALFNFPDFLKFFNFSLESQAEAVA